MKKLLSTGKTSFIIVLVTIIIASFYSCQEDVFTEDEVVQNELKNGTTVTPEGTLPGGALYEIVLPLPVEQWNVLPVKNLIVYAHGYVDFNDPVALPSDEVGGMPIKDLVLGLGTGYASTSYHRNGLVIKDAIDDLKELRETIDDFFETPGLLPPDFIYLVGPSEGALITALYIEKYPSDYNGAIALCGPIGNFYRQLQYFGDALLLFKYFFFESFEFPPLSGNMVNLGTPAFIPPETIAAWKMDIGDLSGLTYLQAKIVEALYADLNLNQGKNIIQF